jgi:hypothetical protein
VECALLFALPLVWWPVFVELEEVWCVPDFPECDAVCDVVWRVGRWPVVVCVRVWWGFAERDSGVGRVWPGCALAE